MQNSLLVASFAVLFILTHIVFPPIEPGVCGRCQPAAYTYKVEFISRMQIACKIFNYTLRCCRRRTESLASLVCLVSLVRRQQQHWLTRKDITRIRHVWLRWLVLVHLAICKCWQLWSVLHTSDTCMHVTAVLPLSACVCVCVSAYACAICCLSICPTDFRLTWLSALQPNS